MHLVNGVALVARLMRSADDLGVDLRTGSPVVRLLSQDGRVTRAVIRSGQSERIVNARCGVVLVAGGPMTWHAGRSSSLTHRQDGNIGPFRRNAFPGMTCVSEKRWAASSISRWRPPARGVRFRSSRTATVRSGTSRTSSTSASPA
ncbi:FAD-binding protein [Ensifer sp. NBAIM29]|nr:FAD-binding protein [Ensifer sp. NBAIM29]